MSSDRLSEQGEKIKFIYKGIEMSGIVVSHDSRQFNIKLSSGYNISVPNDSIEITESERIQVSHQHSSPSHDQDAEVEIIATGGTIASRVDYITGAVTPVFDPGILGENIPNINSFRYDVKIMDPILSENMTPEIWQNIGNMVKESQMVGRSTIILHGTDTMAYTASALAFMFRSLHRPVILVGSQRSSDRPSTDAFLNLEAALEFSRINIGEVGICMHSSISDTSVSLLRGVRTRKMHSSRRDAFRSPGVPPMASYVNGSSSVNPDTTPCSTDSLDFKPSLEKKVSLVYFHPMMEPEDFSALSEGKKIVVIAGTGMGHVSSKLFEPLKELSKEGTRFMMTTQCLGGRVDLDVYSTGRRLTELGVIPLGDMFPETALVKAMHVAANYPEEKFRETMISNMRGEILSREVEF
ncbi:MAG: Glu-tRNA(Gln) amidotransferase subunit GatD [Thermoplasmataceae archaeon]|jgi:glutamyl-tRNA(Gln) amidotransferase subunit D